MATPDPEDVHSLPVRAEATRHGQLFTLPTRADPAKPGRRLRVAWDERAPLAAGFANSYTYLVHFGPAGSRAGNHFHRAKSELFFAVSGAVRVTLRGLDAEREDADPDGVEQVDLTDEVWRALLVPAGVAHVVTARTDGAILLVVASSAGTRADEYQFAVEPA